MSGRDDIRAAVFAGNFDDVEAIVAENPRSVRRIVGLMYGLDEDIRTNCAKALVIAAKYHPKLIKRVIKNLVWAMDEQSGTYAPTAPEILKIIANDNPELLVPMMGELVRLASDSSLNEGLSSILRVVANRCPGELGRKLAKSLNTQMKYGKQCHIASRR
ncbi:MAG: hypothetical protein GY854_21210 [Deltaproteobacteria bacterium]|nr:hypothetical protein [Deltaproteobacteria bacterium]